MSKFISTYPTDELQEALIGIDNEGFIIITPGNYDTRKEAKSAESDYWQNIYDNIDKQIGYLTKIGKKLKVTDATALVTDFLIIYPGKSIEEGIVRASKLGLLALVPKGTTIYQHEKLVNKNKGMSADAIPTIRVDTILSISNKEELV